MNRNLTSLLKALLLFLLSGLLLFLLAGPIISRLIDINNYKQQIAKTLENATNRRISIGKIAYEWHLGPEFIVNDLHVKEKDSDQIFCSAKKISFRLSISQLLRNKIKFGYIVVDGLKARIIRDQNGVLNIDDILSPQQEEKDLLIRKIRLKDAEIVWMDHSIPGNTQELTVSNIEFYADQLIKGKRSKVGLYARIRDNHGVSILKTHGSLIIPRIPSDIRNSIELDGSMELKQFHHGILWRYLGKHIPFENPGGTTDLDITLKGKLNDLRAKGYIKFNNPRIIWRKVFNYTVSPSHILMDFDLKRTSSTVDLHSIKLMLDGFALHGAAKLTEMDTKDPHLFARATTGEFEYRNVKTYIPFGIIEKDASDFIENKLKAGRFRLETGTIEGHFSRLSRFTEGDNANALHINGTVEDAVIRYGENTPLFNRIKGALELKGRNFHLNRMSGSFGSSPFTLDGSITDYSTSGVPSEYPFSMNITPKPAEVAWLAAIPGIDVIGFSGDSSLKLTGEGPVKEYRLSGDWLLQRAAYELPGVVRKPSGMQNSLKFSSILRRDETKLTSMTYLLQPLQVSATAKLRYTDKTPYFEFDLLTNKFFLNRNLPILNILQKYNPNGLMQANIKGKGEPTRLSSMHYNGNVRFSDFSARIWDKMSDLSGITGELSLKGNSVESSEFRAMAGKTPLTFRGRIAAINNPEIELFVASPAFLTSDFGLEPPTAPVIRKFSANLSYREGLVTVRNISGRMDKSVFSAAGTIKPDREPDINLRVSASYLDMQEFLDLIPPSRNEDIKSSDTFENLKSGNIHPFRLKSSVFAENGNYKGLNFSRLSALVDNEGGLLQMRKLNASLFGGNLKAKGQLQRIYNKPNRWNLFVELDRVRSDELMHSLGITRETTGLLSAAGNLRAEGDTLDSLKRTATGNISMNMERGVLRRFHSIAKVLSLLNLSQILTLRIPDMSTEGMPFNKITATASVKNGVITSQDFFINSNAMHISMIGNINIVDETLDLLIGVHPLQAVDKVVSRIPVVGWILTGGDGSILTAYFEAKGVWSDPSVNAIPVKSMAGGTFDIFRRIFELPVRLFTDTGEVILGNQKERPKAKDVR